MSIDKARPDFIAAQEILSNRWPMDVLEALDTCIRELARAEFAKLIPVPADMRKPEDGGAVARLQGYADDPMWAAHAEVPKSLLHEALATIAERDRRIAELEAGLGTADSWLMLHARHVGSCLGKSLCTCGLTLARAETGALLSEPQASEGRV